MGFLAKRWWQRLGGVLCWLILSATSFASAASEPAADGVYAEVNGEIISQAQLHAYVAEAVRQRFYHGKVSADQLSEFQAQMGQQLIDRVLLLQEARRRQVPVDDEAIAARLTALPKDHAQGAVALRARLEEDSLLVGLRAQLAQASEPTWAAVEDYYDTHKEKFTRPEQLHLGLILLTVPPYAPASQWRQAQEQAQQLVAQLAEGAGFAVLAQEYSGHESAATGGDLGFVHKGMLSDEVQEVVDGLTPGVISAPVMLLQGVAVLRLEARIAPQLNEFEVVKDKAKQLLARERAQRNWQQLITQLRATRPIRLGADQAGL